jgi:hypothetical protein
MDSFIHADIFFFITSVAVILMAVLFCMAGFYLIPTLKNFRDISKTLKRGVEKAEEGIENAYNHVEDSPIFRFIFGRGKKRNHK